MHAPRTGVQPLRAILYRRFGEPAAVLQAEDIPVPEPGVGEVLVRLGTRPINPSDLLPVRGAYPHRTPLPSPAGFEGVGWVAAVGSAVTALSAGDRVLPIGGPGTWAEFKCCRADACVPVPDDIPDDAAAQLFINPVTAWAMLTDVLALPAGAWIVANAAASAFGRVLAQLSAALDFRLIGIVRRRAQIDPLQALGAAAVIDGSAEPVVERVCALTNGAGASAALDAVGGNDGARLLDCVAPGGVLVNYGLLSGRPLVLASDGARARQIAVCAFWLRDWLTKVPPAHRRIAFDAVIDLAARGVLTFKVAARYPLEEIAAAVRHAERPGRVGKVMLAG